MAEEIFDFLEIKIDASLSVSLILPALPPLPLGEREKQNFSDRV